VKTTALTFRAGLTVAVLLSLIVGFVSSIILGISLPMRVGLIASIAILSIGTVSAAVIQVRAELAEYDYTSALVTGLLYTGVLLVCVVAGVKAILVILGSRRPVEHWVMSSVSWGIAVLLFALWLATIDEALKAFKKNRQQRNYVRIVGGWTMTAAITAAIAYAELLLWGAIPR